MRLIDADELRNWIMKNPFANTHDFLDAVYDAPTIEAVQGQEERDNGCSTCDGATYMYGDFTVVRPNDGKPWDDGPYTKWFTDGAPFFSHCPCCGRKLRRVDDD